MNKDAKATEYRIEPLVKILRSEAISDGGTEKKASELKGMWVRLNETMFAFVEDNKVTVVYNDETEFGCACKAFSDPTMNILCEHILAFEGLKNPTQLSIESREYRWLQRYLLELGWHAENGYLYPSLAAPEVVAELPPIGESTKLDPVNEDHDLDPGVGEDAQEGIPQGYSRKCTHCGYIEFGEDLEQVKQLIDDHRRDCPKNPANKKKEAPQKPSANETVAPEKQKEDKKVKPNTAVAKPEPRTPAVKKEMPSEAEFQSAKVGRLMRSQGSIYKVSGKEVADSAAVSSYAVSEGVSTETTVLEQTAEYARATVRAYKGGRYTEGSVLIRRDAILEKVVIDLAEKNTDWITGWSNGLPEFDLNQKVFIGDKSKILGLHIAGVVADKWMFASRDCETKAGRRAQIKILGADWREDDEVESEVEEMNVVAKR
jgi:hypothetical protein